MTESEIRLRAYYLWELKKKSGIESESVANWYQAQYELAQEEAFAYWRKIKIMKSSPNSSGEDQAKIN